MNDRIKEIRLSKKLSQSKFAEDIGVSLSNIQSYELGRRNPSNAFIHLLCEKYKVNETWLRTGDGEMYAPRTREQEIADISVALFNDDNEKRNNLISIIASLTDEQIETLNEVAEMWVERNAKK